MEQIDYNIAHEKEFKEAKRVSALEKGFADINNKMVEFFCDVYSNGWDSYSFNELSDLRSILCRGYEKMVMVHDRYKELTGRIHPDYEQYGILVYGLLDRINEDMKGGLR